MARERDPKSAALLSAVMTVQNLRPKAFEIAIDHEADIKERWKAFDELYDAVCEELRNKRLSPEEILTPPQPKMTLGLETLPDPTEEQIERSRRVSVAMNLFVCKYQGAEGAINEAMLQADALVPQPPDPNTGKPGLSLTDQALLNVATNVVRTDMPDDWDCFFKGHSEPAAKRKASFRKIYLLVAKTWMHGSLFPQSLTPEQRQWWVIFAMMCHVPGDQWGPEDMKQLIADLLPIEEPDWNDKNLFGP